jgi:Methyltransferase FkbM domain
MCNLKTLDDLATHGNLMAQDAEDIEALKWFNGLCNGTYIELGGFDGKTYSNTYVFNREFDWRGLLVELVPYQYATLVKNRPNEIATLNAAVCGKRGTVHFIEREFASGVWEFAAPSFIAQWWTPLGITKEKDGKPIACLPLQDIIEENIPAIGGSNKLHYFDFFSLDTEGSELSILKTINFSKIGFGIIAIEADETNERKNMAIRSLLQEKGYSFLGDKKRSYWFVNNQFGRIYEDRMHA